MTQYNYTPAAGLLGADADAQDGVKVSRSYPKRQEQWTVTIAGTPTDGTYSQRFLKLPGNLDPITISVVRSSTPATNNDLAAQMKTNCEANAILRSLFTFSVASNVVTVVRREAGVAFTLDSATAPAPGTLAVAQSVAATKADLPLGIAVKRGTNGRELALLTSSDEGYEIDGIVARSAQIAPQKIDGSADTYDDDVYEAGSHAVSIKKQGVIWVRPETSVSKGGKVYVRRNATGTEQVGALRASHDGVAQVLDVSPTEVNDAPYGLHVQVKNTDTGEVVATATAFFLADASATETEITTGLKADLDANANLLQFISTGTDGSGDDISLRLTADSPEYEIHADYTDAGVIVFTEATAQVLDTVLLKNAQWDDDGVAEGLVPLRLNLPS